ncbi:MAG: bifunctional phosphoribosyl-AMP cyclohydrolase/phosphoribosyl-ATP diphosphatase HisIE [Acidobacteriota bacterium]
MTRVEDLKYDAQGLVPVVVQDAETGEVLTQAYMSAASLARTRELGQTVFYSRSRRALWHKGETSGNCQDVVAVAADCDGDSLLVRVAPRGPACHTGSRSCFFEPVEGFPAPPDKSFARIMRELEQVIRARHSERPEGSYTAQLFERGKQRILQKLGEEATETIIAGMSGDREGMIREAADLLFHILVALREAGIYLEEVAGELHARRR